MATRASSCGDGGAGMAGARTLSGGQVGWWAPCNPVNSINEPEIPRLLFPAPTGLSSDAPTDRD